MRICFLIQTHKCPAQIDRLVRTIKRSLPDCFLLISHDYAGVALEPATFQQFPELAVIAKQTKGIRGDFSLVQAYLDAIAWLLEHQIEFDWLINLSGQDYPIQPLSQLAQMLAQTSYDGWLEYFLVLSKQSPWGIREGHNRYYYQYWQSGYQLKRWQRALLKPIKTIVNNSQAHFRLNFTYGVSLGKRANSPPFISQFCCYGGSFFKTLSRKCVEYLYHYSQQHTVLAQYYAHTRQPDESYVQTILLNAEQFRFSDRHLMYFDFSNTRDGHPRLLTRDDFEHLWSDREHFFARKFEYQLESEQNPSIFDLLDQKLFEQNIQIKHP